MKTHFINWLCGIITSLCAATSPAAGKATVKVAAAKSGSGVVLNFTTLPADGLKINAEGPWKLEIKSITGAKPAAKEFKRDAWKEGIAGFEVPASPEHGAKAADISFKMTTFVCTKDKKYVLPRSRRR